MKRINPLPIVKGVCACACVTHSGFHKTHTNSKSKCGVTIPVKMLTQLTYLAYLWRACNSPNVKKDNGV